MNIIDITDNLLETGLFNNGVAKQTTYLKNIVMKFLMITLNFKRQNVAPLILHLIVHYISKPYLKLYSFFEEYLTLNNENNIIQNEIIFDKNSCMLYILNEIINGLKDETYIFEFIIQQQKKRNIYIGIETRFKWYYLNLKNNKILSNKEHDTTFKLLSDEQQKASKYDMHIFVKLDFNNIKKEGLVLMKINNQKWSNTRLRFAKEENTRIIFGCIETIDNTKEEILKQTKVILASAYKRINKTDQNLYKNY